MKTTFKQLLLISASTLTLIAGSATAQNTALSADELEKLLAEQKAALEEVIENRSETQSMADKLREELAKSEEQKGLVQKELEALCKQHEELQADSYKDCMRQSDS